MLSELENTLKYDNSTSLIEKLQKLIDILKKNEKDFYNEVLQSGTPNFLITSYYSIYLRFLEILSLKLRKNSIQGNDEDMLDYLVSFFGRPLLIYLKKKEVIPQISKLTGAILSIIINWKLEHKNDSPRIPQIVIDFILNLDTTNI